MQKIKMIGLDLDGTLLNEKKELTARTRRALERAIDSGVQVVLSTGRPMTGIPEELLSISGMKYIITSNGGRILELETGKVLFENPVPHETAEQILRITQEYETLNEIYFDGQGFAQKNELAQIQFYVKNKAMQEYIVSTRCPIDDIWEKMNEMQGKGLDKVHAIFARTEEMEEARERVTALGAVVCSSSLGNNIEMNAVGVNKGEGLLKLGEILGISREEIMACGDGENDLAMIRKAGLGVAMANAVKVVREAADEITDSNQDEGVAKAIERFVLGEK